MTTNRILTFELTSDRATLEIYCDRQGLDDLILFLKRLFALRPDKREHDHWMVESFGGWEITEKPQGAHNALIKMVSPYYWPAEPAEAPLLTFEYEKDDEQLEIHGNLPGYQGLLDRLSQLTFDDPKSQALELTSPTRGGSGLTSENQNAQAALIHRVVVRLVQ
jgi:hypothetical protein